MLRTDVLLSGKFLVEERIGQGSFGNVYKGVDITLDRPIAIKELLHSNRTSPGSTTDISFDEQFRREIRLQARFNHPNIVQVYELLAQGPDLYLIMEYVDGPSLRDWIDGHPSPPVGDALAIFKDILNGLQAVHDDPRDIVHRDLKPDNILLTRQHVAKLADFGLAQEGDASLRSLFTGSARPCHPGSITYRSPEHCPSAGSPPDYLYPVSDIYSAGCILFEMLTALTYRRAASQGQAIAQLRPDLSADLCRFVEQLLAEDPARRLANGGAALAALGQLFAGSSAQPAPPLTPADPTTTPLLPVHAPLEETSTVAGALRISLRRQDHDRWTLAIHNLHAVPARQIHLFLRPPDWVAVSPTELKFGGLISGMASPSQNVFIRPRRLPGHDRLPTCEIRLDVIYRLEGDSTRHRLPVTLPLPPDFCSA